MALMTISGSRTVRADRRAVWAALHDVGCLKACVPGCQSLVRVSDGRFGLVVDVSFGPVRIPFRGSVEVDGSDPPHCYRMVGRGEGGLAGLAAGSATIRLTQVAGGCRLGYVIRAEPQGPFAALGSVVVTGLARSLTDRFIDGLAGLLERDAGRPVRPGIPAGRPLS